MIVRVSGKKYDLSGGGTLRWVFKEPIKVFHLARYKDYEEAEIEVFAVTDIGDDGQPKDVIDGAHEIKIPCPNCGCDGSVHVRDAVIDPKFLKRWNI